MMHFNIRRKTCSAGFSFIEVIVALALIGIIAVTLLNLQSTLLKTSYRARALVERVILMSTYLREQHKADLEQIKLPQEKTSSDSSPVIQLQYSTQKCTIQGLHEINGLITERVQSSWQEFGKRYQDNIVFIRYKPEPVES